MGEFVSIATLRREIYAEVGRALKSLGFRKAAGRQLFLKELATGVEGALELTDVKRGDELAVSLGVGLIVADVERLIADWCSGSAVATFTTVGNVGYLKSEQSWVDSRFNDGSPIESGVRELIDLAVSDAVPFLEAHASLDGVAEVLERGTFPTLKRLAEERLPILYALNGHTQQAATTLAQIVDDLANDEGSAMSIRRSAYLAGYRDAFPDVG
jgi:hypothetical protein